MCNTQTGSGVLQVFKRFQVCWVNDYLFPWLKEKKKAEILPCPSKDSLIQVPG